MRLSRGTVGNAYDNAMAESFFASLEYDLIARRTWKTMTEASLAMFTWMKVWYPRRGPSGLYYQSPDNFEGKHHEKSDTAEEQIVYELQ